MLHYPCPYVINTEFSLLVTIPQYNNRPNSLPQQICTTARVLQTYTFTRSQGMKVALNWEQQDESLPSVAFLKLYDRRYLDERMEADAEEPWNPEREAEAEKFAKILSNGTTMSGDSDDGSSDDDHSSDRSEDGVENQWHIEQKFRRWTKNWFNTEVRAYHQLHALQDICIPRFFGITAFDQNSPRIPSGIHFDVHGILLDFIDGMGFDVVHSDSSLALKYPHIGEHAVCCMEKINELGVLHGDIRMANIMVRNEDGRVVVIDFGLATFRKKNESECEWSERVDSEREVGYIKDCLDEKGLRDRTPIEPYSLGHEGFTYYNALIDASREAWRNKYFEQISEVPEFVIRTDDDGNEVLYCPINWRIKKDAAQTRREYLNRMRR